MSKAFENTFEAEAFIRVEFNFQISLYGTITIHLADCGLDVDILGLKQDLKHYFAGLEPSDQIWSYRSITMENDRTLRSYGLMDGPGQPVKIFVKGSSGQLSQ